jgi:cytochrome c oxidase subunit 2
VYTLYCACVGYENLGNLCQAANWSDASCVLGKPLLLLLSGSKASGFFPAWRENAALLAAGADLNPARCRLRERILEEKSMRTILAVTLSLLVGASLLAAEKKEADVKKIGAPAPAGAPVKEVEISAKKYEYTPATIEVPVNTVVRFNLKATDREHGFEFKSVKDSCVKFKPDAPATLEFYADKPGEYEFNCCKFCGFGHSKMKGKLLVK